MVITPKKAAFGIFAFLILIAPLILNWIKVRNFCFNGYDLGLYHEMIVDIAVPENMNPHLSVRGLKAFNDHSNPVLIPASVLIKVLDNILSLSWAPIFAARDVDVMSTLAFEWLAWIIAGVVLWSLLKSDKPRVRYSAVLIFFLSKGMLNGLYYPMHVDFCLTAAWIVLVWGLVRRKRAAFFTSLILICLSKESYPIAFLFMATAMYFLGYARWSLVTFGIAGSAVVWNQVFRQIVLGPVHGFADHLFADILKSPLLFAVGWWQRMPIGALFEIYLIPLVFLYLVWKKHRQIGFILAAVLAPLFGLHLLAGLVEYHYSFWLPTVGLSAAFFTGVWSKISEDKRYFRAVLIFVAVPGIMMHVNHARFLWVEDRDCKVSSNYREEFRRVQLLLEHASPEAVIGATGGVVPNLVAVNRDLRHLKSHSLVAEKYDYLIFEVGPATFPHPLNNDQIRSIQIACAPSTSEKVFEGKHLVLWKGPFPKQCIYQ